MVKPLLSQEKVLALQQLMGRGVLAHQQGRLAEAEALYLQALQHEPDLFDARHLLGVLRGQQGRFEEALAQVGAALRAKPDAVEALSNYGLILHMMRRDEEALASFDKALALQPGNAEMLNNRGNALAELKRYEEALVSYDRALALRPDYVEVFNNRGNALDQLRRYEDALASYDRALALRPNYAEAFGGRGNALVKLKSYEQALAAFDRALTLRGDDADTHYNRANTLLALRRPDLAAAGFERALSINPDDGNALGGLASATLAVCDWRRLAGLRAQLADHVRGSSTVVPFALLAVCDDPALLRQCAEKFMARQVPVMPSSLSATSRFRHEKIRIAYLSADFRSHVMAYQLAELFGRHDRGRFEVTGVSFAGDDGSEIRKRLVKSFDRFIDVAAMADGDVARLLRDAEIDIAVDLMGHTLDARFRIFAHRPAPIQVSYLGYAGTSGAEFLDYIIGDAVVLPMDQQPFYSEKIVQLPDSFFVVDSERAISLSNPSRRDAGLPEQGFVFCCFNNTAKIQPEMFDIWMRLLRAVAGSVLWLSARNAGAQDNLRREAQARGVDLDRLVFAERVPEMADHLARLRLADLFLDTLPYNAHATAGDALWAGLPVLTCCGKTFAGRVGASLVRAAGLPDLVTENLEDYEALALRLATEPGPLGEIRGRLAHDREGRPLFDTARFCRHLESAYTSMWNKWQCGEAKQGFRVAALEN